ncbi:metallophosphoesterase [Leisingera sp. ANG-M7]|uniref:metallophosphoesterase n=1 Tax=Leisingera sp. ANG-M7 TaxID=1577902 RepID=UPI00057E798A|nr:metallophosphoesterase [Leisingera sp. ANG-M7]KIC37272.1 metallophosphoesterase [Leisingera sp. ANG-M7]
MTRRSFLRGLLAVTLAGLFAALYGFFIEPALRLRVRRWKVRREDWTAPPLRIAVIADVHAGEPWVGERRVRQVVRRVNAVNADLVLLLGDYAAGHRFVAKPVKIAEVAPLLAECRARHGVFAVLGNHDWWDDLAAQKRGGGPNLYAKALETAGISVLSNQALRLDEAGIWLAGLEDQLAIRRNGRWNGLDDLPGTLAQVTDGAPVVLMAHEPDIFPKVPARVALTLSGHTHGGQVRLFGWSPVVPSKFGNRYAYGHVREQGRDLVVSGGIGCSILPVRFGSAPEVTVIEVSS